MILQALKEYGERNVSSAKEGVVPDAFADDVPIHWLLEIDSQGNFLDLRHRGGEQSDEKGKKKPVVPPMHKVPKKVFNSRSSGNNPEFLADNLEYFFGLSAKSLGPTSFKIHREHAESMAKQFPDERTLAVKAFFGKLASKEIDVTWDANAKRGNGKLVISAPGISRRYPVKGFKERIALCLAQDNWQPVFHTAPSVVRYWSEHYESMNSDRGKDRKLSSCACCGKMKAAVTTFDQYDGLPGGATFLICYGKPAFHSYGFQDGENASLCLPCMKSIIRGMNALLKSPSTHKLIRYGKPKPGETEKIAPVMFAFWCKEPVDFDFGKVSDADTESVKNLLESVRRGVPQQVAEKNFYILGFSRSAKLRTLVRYWSETNIKDVVENLAAWFAELNDRFTDYGPTHRPLSFIRLCQTTVRQPDNVGDEWKFPPLISTGLFLSAFLRKSVPPPVLQMVVSRVRAISQTDYDLQNPFADYKLKPARMALLRITLNRLMKCNDPKFSVGLDVGREEPEYHCGRLLAVCDHAMRWSNSPQAGKPGMSTVADRYMGSASTAPCSVLPVVYRNSRHHLNKLKRDMPAKGQQLEKLLDEILSKLTAYPVTLPAQKAGTFILGFHHQRQYFFLVSRYRKLKEQAEKSTLAPEDKKELESLDDFVRRSHFDVSLLADLPDEEAPPITAPEPE